MIPFLKAALNLRSRIESSRLFRTHLEPQKVSQIVSTRKAGTLGNATTTTWVSSCLSLMMVTGKIDLSHPFTWPMTQLATQTNWTRRWTTCGTASTLVKSTSHNLLQWLRPTATTLLSTQEPPLTTCATKWDQPPVKSRSRLFSGTQVLTLFGSTTSRYPQQNGTKKLEDIKSLPGTEVAVKTALSEWRTISSSLWLHGVQLPLSLRMQFCPMWECNGLWMNSMPQVVQHLSPTVWQPL